LIVSIGLLEVESGMTDPADYLAGSANGEGEIQFDFVGFTPRRDRPDPCEKLEPPHGR
jgi:hypothetical protein